MGSQSPVQGIGPVEKTARIDAMDVARGFALLGIFCVNILSFSSPFAEFVDQAPKDQSWLQAAAFYFVKVLCEGKFYTLFSTLFGMGLVLQRSRAQSRGARFFPMYIRRLVMLAAMGLCHALFLWYGDILFVYSLAGIVVMACSGLRGRTLIIAGIVVLTISTLVASGMAVLMTGAPPQPSKGQTVSAPAVADKPASPAPQESPAVTAPETSPPAAPSDTAPGAAPTAKQRPLTELWDAPVMRILQGFQDGSLPREMEQKSIAPFQTDTWRQAEIESFRDGPFSHATGMRALTFGFMLLFIILGFGWSIVAMFLIGAGMVKSGFFEDANAHRARKLVLIGACVGLPLAIAAAAIPAFTPPRGLAAFVITLMAGAGNPLVALAYLSGVTLLVRSGAARGLCAAVGTTGRMAVTNYLLQTVIATTLFYHFGFAQFDQWSRPACLAFVFAIWAAQVVFSNLWMSHFRFGPVEWLWRSWTYLSPQPFLRDRSGA